MGGVIVELLIYRRSLWSMGYGKETAICSIINGGLFALLFPFPDLN
ncbi:MAG: hypothetical protein F6K18_04380 [Okeania sp. SIO2C2]|nr:hypothetical protein [Okeania sp. SIO2C2]NEP86115.1 hypothetical protein [Okeania sp. SIO2C2]